MRVLGESNEVGREIFLGDIGPTTYVQPNTGASTIVFFMKMKPVPYYGTNVENQTLSSVSYFNIVNKGGVDPNNNSISKDNVLIQVFGGNNNILSLQFGDYLHSQNNMHTTNPVADNTWHHIAWTRNGTTYKLYVDGVLDNVISGTPMQFTWYGQSILYLADSGTTNTSIPLYDEFGMFDYELSSTQIAQLANQTPYSALPYP